MYENLSTRNLAILQFTVHDNKHKLEINYKKESNTINTIGFLCRFEWRASSANGDISGSGRGVVRAGGVYVLCVRERLGRLDTAVLHAPNPPNELNLAWIVPQYVLVSMAEIMFAVSGLEFSFTQVSGKSRPSTS